MPQDIIREVLTPPPRDRHEQASESAELLAAHRAARLAHVPQRIPDNEKGIVIQPANRGPQ